MTPCRFCGKDVASGEALCPGCLHRRAKTMRANAAALKCDPLSALLQLGKSSTTVMDSVCNAAFFRYGDGLPSVPRPFWYWMLYIYIYSYTYINIFLMIPIRIPKDPQHASGDCTCSGKLMAAKTKMKHHAFLDVYMWFASISEHECYDP